MVVASIGENARRDQITIMVDLLHNIQEPRRLTHLLYRSNMSYSQLVKYLQSLKDMGLIKQTERPYRAYTITDNGKSFMQLVKKDTQEEISSAVE